jgi:electron transport complex protein RnfB
MVVEDVYERLAEHLDNLPGSFPATEEGIELRILQRLFTPDQAALALHLSLVPEPCHIISRRSGLPANKTAQMLEKMAEQGLIFCLHRDDKPPLYMASQYVVGIWEFQVNHLDPELVKDMANYIPYLFEEGWKVPQLRTIPINESIDHSLHVLPYENADDILRQQDKLLVAPCICRQERRLVGEGCDRPLESCLIFGEGVDYYAHNGLGRRIDVQEAKDILVKANEAGLVLQPGNTRTPGNICTCCGCCCGVLRTLNTLPRPVDMVVSSFIARVDVEKCSGCGVCVTRCQMRAVIVDDDKAVINYDRCIGCGLCVSTCPTHALTLERKPQDEQPYIPRGYVDRTVRQIIARGRKPTRNLVKMLVQSGIDRLVPTHREPHH